MKTAKLRAETIVSKLFDAITARVQTLRDNGLVVSSEFKGIIDHLDPQGSSYSGFVKAVDNCKKRVEFDTLISIVGKAKPARGNDDAYVQAKVIEKIIKLVKGIGFNDFKILDNHTRSLLINTTVNNARITSKVAFATLVKVEFDALDPSQGFKLKARNNYTAGTGSTQLSSSREMLRIMGLSESAKGKRDADFTFTDDAHALFNERFEAIAKLTGSDASEAHEEGSEAEEQE
ncbi:hypothetical protein [Herbaspirillum huttiense]|uniref:Uncharacterized protein n=1 Tax=Herbaspirillum huttiense subsp. lycopersici TaxID=3074428 RepID=A0ABU2EFY9_9BURK|nr:hypothetical protein [Herbaspirillum huttiense]MDR9847045.1 hypothetical protein [Herbaspirillum huttiense SE1]